uniref:Uncharacterized protein n=1 Tax=Anopheles melas TaxID=34690 RepID=A0A182UIC6_9DIPT
MSADVISIRSTSSSRARLARLPPIRAASAVSLAKFSSAGWWGWAVSYALLAAQLVSPPSDGSSGSVYFRTFSAIFAAFFATIALISFVLTVGSSSTLLNEKKSTICSSSSSSSLLSGGCADDPAPGLAGFAPVGRLLDWV